MVRGCYSVMCHTAVAALFLLAVGCAASKSLLRLQGSFSGADTYTAGTTATDEPNINQWYRSDAPTYEWSGLASDSSGQYVVAATGSPFSRLYRSANYGLNFTAIASAPSGVDWASVVTNATGEFIAAAAAGNIIYVSFDSGGTWTPAAGIAQQNWEWISCSSSGQYLTAVFGDGFNGIYMSSNYGLDWTPTNADSIVEWRSCAQSADGRLVYATATGTDGSVYLSQNYGLDWVQTAATPNSYHSITISHDGLYAAAISNDVGIFVTGDTGTTWQASDAPALSWAGIVSDATGQYMVAVATSPNGAIYRSADYGVTWQPSFTANFYWSCVASDSTGRYLTAGTEVFEGIYTTAGGGSTFKPTAAPSLAPSLQPSSLPSSQPSNQPSSFPTYEPGSYERSVSVVALTAASKVTLSNLGHRGHIYVTANLLLSYLDVDSGGFITITAGSSGGNMIYVSQECAPVAACPTSKQLMPTYCAVNVDVTSALTSDGGGTLQLNAVTNTLDISGANPALCNRNGVQDIYYELNYTVSAFRQPTLAPTTAPTPQPTSTSGTVIINKQNNLVTDEGAPFYVIGVVMAAFAALGVLIVRLRDRAKGLARLRLLAVCCDLALQGNLIVSEVFYIIVLLQSSTKLFGALAIVLIFARMQNAVVGGFLLYRLYRPSTQLYEKLNKEVLLLHTKIHSVVQMLMVFDCAMFRYLPWVASDSTFQSMSFPDPLSFKLCMATRVLQSGIALVVQGIVLDKLNESDLNDGYTLGLMALILVMTGLLFVSIILTVVMHLREMKSPPGQSVDGTVNTRSNPLHALELGAMGPNGAEAAVWEERVTLLEMEVAALRDKQQEQREDQEALRALLESNTAELVREVTALKAAVAVKNGKGGAPVPISDAPPAAKS
jgi:hypothetical protein